MNSRWMLAEQRPVVAEQLGRVTGVSSLLAQCLINRGYTDSGTIQPFLQPRLKSLADPFLIPNMDRAVRLLWAARGRGEMVVIFGDYDVDGVTSTALLVEFLTALGWRVNWYLPHRMDEGYGLTRDGVENCLKQFPSRFLLAVDCGSSAVETIGLLRQQGVEVLVLDHHQVSDPAPDASALVNPQLGRADQPSYRELCSAGLAFKLAHALVKHGRQLGIAGFESFDLRPFLDLVALGSIADIVPLTGENRILVTAGLERLNRTTRPGLLALMQVAQIQGQIGVYEVGFQLGPRLNAAGRLENAAEALDLVLADSMQKAAPLAKSLDLRNRERQQIERSIADEAVAALRKKFNPDLDYVIVEARSHWHIGVVGIVASRVLREFYRPTIILGDDEGQWRGSGRSIEGFDLASALRECAGLLVRHGGHAMAAGLACQVENLDAFRSELNDLARRSLSLEQLQPLLKIDAETTLSSITLERLEEFNRIEPVGQGNRAINLMTSGVRLQRPPLRMGKSQQHAKLWVTDGRVVHEVVWWNAPPGSTPTGPFDLAFAPEINEFNGRKTIQLKLLDWRPA